MTEPSSVHARTGLLIIVAPPPPFPTIPVRDAAVHPDQVADLRLLARVAPALRPDLARRLLASAGMHAAQDRPDIAWDMAHAALAMLRDLAAAAPELRPDLARALHLVGALAALDGDSDAAQERLDAACTLLRDLAAADPALRPDLARAQIASAVTTLFTAAEDAGDVALDADADVDDIALNEDALQRAESLFRAAKSLLRSVIDVDDPTQRADLAQALGHLAGIAFLRRDRRRARALLRDALTLTLTAPAAARAPAVRMARARLLLARAAMRTATDHARALADLRAAAALAAPPPPGPPGAWRSVTPLVQHIGIALAQRGARADAGALLRQVIPACARAAAAAAPTPARHLVMLGAMLRALSDAEGDARTADDAMRHGAALLAAAAAATPSARMATALERTSLPLLTAGLVADARMLLDAAAGMRLRLAGADLSPLVALTTPLALLADGALAPPGAEEPPAALRPGRPFPFDLDRPFGRPRPAADAAAALAALGDARALLRQHASALVDPASPDRWNDDPGALLLALAATVKRLHDLADAASRIPPIFVATLADEPDASSAISAWRPLMLELAADAVRLAIAADRRLETTAPAWADLCAFLVVDTLAHDEGMCAAVFAPPDAALVAQARRRAS